MANQDNDSNFAVKIGIKIAFAFLCFFLFVSIFKGVGLKWIKVEGDEVAVRQHLTRGVDNQVLYSGTHFMFPAFQWTGTYIYKIGTQKITFDDKNSNPEAEYDRIPVEVGENGGQAAWVALSVNYHLNAEKIVMLHKQGIGKTYESVVLKREIVDVVNEIARPYKSALEIYSGSGFVEFKNRVEKELKTNPVLKERGIEVENTIIYNVHLDARYEKEIADKQLAIQENLTKIEQTKAQEQEAKRIFAESQANVEKERQIAEGQKIKVVKEAEAQNESAILAAKAEKAKKILDAEGERDANLAKASGILAIGKAQAEANTLLREASYAGDSGAWKAKVEIATKQAEKFATITNKISIMPEKAWMSLSGDTVNPKPVIQANDNQ